MGTRMVTSKIQLCGANMLVWLMAKSKEHKRIEAGYRKIRGDLVSEFRLGDQNEVVSRWGAYHVERRNDLIAQYMRIPRSVRETLMEGWLLTPELKNRLEIAHIEEDAALITEATAQTQAPARRMRL